MSLVKVTSVPGELNTSQAQRLENIRHSITLGLPQVRHHAPNDRTVCLVGSGPSLNSTLDNLLDCIKENCAVVAMNGAYGWLLERQIVPSAMTLIDSRAFNARFLTEPVDTCQYFIASQCAPETFEKVRGWRGVHIWHCLTGEDKDEKALLDGYYLGTWQSTPGGCTVGLRTITLMHILGFKKMQLFGMDSCYMDNEGHAMSQPENSIDDAHKITCADKTFLCSSWHVSQALEFMDMIAMNGEHFELSVHGEGLLAHIVQVGGQDDELKDALTRAKEGV